MPPKTEWGNPQIFIQNGDNREPIEVQQCNSLMFIEENPTPHRDLCRAFKNLTLSFTLAAVQMRKWMALFGVDGRKLPAIRVRTGIAPKWRNRTRRKQRLTRLQRRAKRQNKRR